MSYDLSYDDQSFCELRETPPTDGGETEQGTSPKRQKLWAYSEPSDALEFFMGVQYQLNLYRHKGGEFEISVPVAIRDKVPAQTIRRKSNFTGAYNVAYLVHD